MLKNNDIEVKDIFGKIPAAKKVNVLGQLVDVPVKYDRVDAVVSMFPISTKKAKDLIGSADFHPVETYPGRCLLNITSFDFLKCPVGPYKEICLSIPVLYKSRIKVPLIPFLFKHHLKNFGFFAYLLTCDTDLSRAHSHDCFGYTVYRNGVDLFFEENAFGIEIKAAEGKDLVYCVRAKKAPILGARRNDFRTFFIDGNDILEVELNANAALGMRRGLGSASLELGSHEISRGIASLDVGKKAIEVWYYRNGIEILNAPRIIGKKLFN